MSSIEPQTSNAALSRDRLRPKKCKSVIDMALDVADDRSAVRGEGAPAEVT